MCNQKKTRWNDRYVDRFVVRIYDNWLDKHDI